MRRFAPFCFLSLLMLASTSILAATMAWALDYGGDSIKSQRFFHDSRTLRIIESDLGPLLKRRDFDGFRGVPYDVHIADARYVWSSSCKAHDCPYNRGFLWLDTQSGASIAAPPGRSCRWHGSRWRPSGWIASRSPATASAPGCRSSSRRASPSASAPV